MHGNKHWDWYVFPLPLATMTIWFSPELEIFRFQQLQFSCTYDTTAHDYDFLFSLSYKSPYDSAHDTNYRKKNPRICSSYQRKDFAEQPEHWDQAINKFPTEPISDFISFRALVGENFDLPTWQVMSLFVKRTTKRYFGVLYLFLSWVTRRLRAK